MLTVENLRAVFLQFGRNPSPIGRKLEIAEEHAVQQQQGIARGADALFVTLCVQPVFSIFKFYFVADDPRNFNELNQEMCIRDRNRGLL